MLSYSKTSNPAYGPNIPPKHYFHNVKHDFQRHTLNFSKTHLIFIHDYSTFEFLYFGDWTSFQAEPPFRRTTRSGSSVEGEGLREYRERMRRGSVEEERQGEWRGEERRRSRSSRIKSETSLTEIHKLLSSVCQILTAAEAEFKNWRRAIS